MWQGRVEVKKFIRGCELCVRRSGGPGEKKSLVDEKRGERRLRSAASPAEASGAPLRAHLIMHPHNLDFLVAAPNALQRTLTHRGQSLRLLWMREAVGGMRRGLRLDVCVQLLSLRTRDV